MRTMKAAALAWAAAVPMAACAGAPVAEPRGPEPLEARAARAERDPIEAFRLYRKGAERGEGACAARLLLFADRKEATLSQREYARLFVEKVLASGAVPAGRAADLHHRLALSWNFLDPRRPSKVREHVEAMARAGMTDEMADSAVVREMIRTTGAQVDLAAARARGRREVVRACDATPADAGLRMEQRGVPGPAAVRGPGPGAVELEVTAWGGGNDKLLQASGVLAFVVNGAGEPVFRGRHLWMRNGSDRAVTVSVPSAGVSHRELKPGAEETLALAGDATTGVDLSVRYAWRR